MTFRISSLPARENPFEARDLVSSLAPDAPGISRNSQQNADRAAIVDLSPGSTRRSHDSGAGMKADAKRIVADLQRLSVGDPGRLIRAQEAPSASRVLDLLK
jgi:hypothetical protein